ncbi:hypothetical protein [Frigoribacterium sp. SL97]|uniref:hypothetical protein n=1 Tax=Frigoribacterium sp. SL97 TaxID=2994664 RepID=UPI00226D59A9|nr:hypothetical protein [Frigoribacterium sp. SL97]WAC50483.1 hypothetical protein OVA02_11435 [Frigoribacterium sp. SL97]
MTEAAVWADPIDPSVVYLTAMSAISLAIVVCAAVVIHKASARARLRSDQSSSTRASVAEVEKTLAGVMGVKRLAQAMLSGPGESARFDGAVEGARAQAYFKSDERRQLGRRAVIVHAGAWALIAIIWIGGVSAMSAERAEFREEAADRAAARDAWARDTYGVRDGMAHAHLYGNPFEVIGPDGTLLQVAIRTVGTERVLVHGAEADRELERHPKRQDVRARNGYAGDFARWATDVYGITSGAGGVADLGEARALAAKGQYDGGLFVPESVDVVANGNISRVKISWVGKTPVLVQVDMFGTAGAELPRQNVEADR